jgi:hypothetical protein
MSQLQTWLGAVASSSGLWYAGWRSWLRRSRTSALAASTRYIVRIEHGGTWPASNTWAQTWAGGRSTNRFRAAGPRPPRDLPASRPAGAPAAVAGPPAPRPTAPPPVEGRTGQPQGRAQGDADLGTALLDQGDHDRARVPSRSSSAAKFFGASTRASARSARPVICVSCRSSSAIFRSRASTGVGLRPRFLGARAANSPRPRARRHTTRCDEYSPSRRNCVFRPS